MSDRNAQLLTPCLCVLFLLQIGDWTYSLLYALHQGFFLFGYGYLISQLDLPVASSLIVLCEQVRMCMKSHSFWRETLRIKHHPTETPRGVNTHHSNSRANSTLLPTWREQVDQFYLFFFVPTLIYRNSYPRTRYIRWEFIAQCTVEVAGCVFYICQLSKQTKPHHPCTALSLRLLTCSSPLLSFCSRMCRRAVLHLLLT